MRGVLVMTAAAAVTLGACLLSGLDGLAGGPDDAGPFFSAESGSGEAGGGGLDASDGSDAGGDGAGGSAYRAAVLADGPVAYWRLGDTGATAKDETGAHPGTYIGSASHGPGAIAGDPDGAFVGDGQGWVDVAQIFPFAGTAGYTIEAWVAPTASATLTGVLARNIAAPGQTPADGYSLYVESPSLAPTMGRWLSSAEQAASAPGLTAGAFSHVVGTYDGATLKVYVNGVLAGSGGSTQSIVTPAADVTLGATRNGTYGLFVGSLDEVALYDKPLAADRISLHHAVGTGAGGASSP